MSSSQRFCFFYLFFKYFISQSTDVNDEKKRERESERQKGREPTKRDNSCINVFLFCFCGKRINMNYMEIDIGQRSLRWLRTFVDLSLSSLVNLSVLLRRFPYHVLENNIVFEVVFTIDVTRLDTRQ